MKTYLCGGIQGLSTAQCTDWREAAKQLLETGTLDPMVRDYRGIEDANIKEIVELDKKDIQNSDILLVNAVRPSWGTAMEVMYAYMHGKPCIAFTEPKSIKVDTVAGNHVSPWVQYHCEVFFTLEDACKRINFLYEEKKFRRAWEMTSV